MVRKVLILPSIIVSGFNFTHYNILFILVEGCQEGTCHPDAYCRVVDDKNICECIDGFVGDGTISCKGMNSIASHKLICCYRICSEQSHSYLVVATHQRCEWSRWS